MGAGASAATISASHGRLHGAVPPQSNRPPPRIAPPQSFRVKIPSSAKSPGSVFRAGIAGRVRTLTVPAGMKGGDTMIYSIPDLTKVYSSTLPSIPGMTTVSVMPIAYGSVSHYFQTEINSAGQNINHVGQLMQEAQEELLLQAVEMGCNGVLGMNFTVTNDSYGEYGESKIVIVAACGTPAVLAHQQEQQHQSSSSTSSYNRAYTNDIPVVQATALVDDEPQQRYS